LTWRATSGRLYPEDEMKRKASEMEAQAQERDSTRKGKPRLRGDEHEVHDKRHIKVRAWPSPQCLVCKAYYM
jgi:hypothetical protein